MRVVNQQVPTPFRDIDLGTLLRPNLARVRAQGAARCRCTRSRVAARSSPRQLGAGLASMDVVLGLAEGAARRASTRARASSATCARCSPTRTAPTTSALLEPELYLTATDLDTCERIVFGADGWDDVPISQRRARLDGAADGLRAGARSATASWSTAASSRRPTSTSPSRRARSSSSSSTRSCPYVNDFAERGQDAARLAPAARLATWASRRSATRRSSCSPTSACTRWRASWEERYPGVDIVLIEPEPDDELMFQTSIMNFTSRVGDRPPRVRVGDAASSPRTTTRYQEVCERHGIEISATRVRKVVKHFDAEKEQDARLAQDPRADDRRAAAPVGVESVGSRRAAPRAAASAAR